MKFSQLKLKTSLTVVVLFLSVLTLAVVGINWYGQQQMQAEFAALINTGVSASSDAKSTYADALLSSMDARFAQLRYVSAGLAALALLMALLATLAMSRMVVKPLKRVGMHFDYIAAGDLTHRIDVSSHNEIGALYGALKRMQDSLGRMVGTVRLGMDEINSGAQQIAAGSTDLSARTREQAAALQQTAA